MEPDLETIRKQNFDALIRALRELKDAFLEGRPLDEPVHRVVWAFADYEVTQ